ncbi:hypothetical protein C8Q75DRAFT_811265 [Abortiporus biennis]|nr:hypothetical protein C8Q75DRAFT_811265 [Abortiporus biennis]
MSHKTDDSTAAPTKTVMQRTLDLLVGVFCTSFEAFVLINLPKSWYSSILNPLLVLDLSIASEVEIDQVWDVFTVYMDQELKMLAGLSTLVLGASVGLIASNTGQSSSFMLVSGTIPVIYALEFAFVATFYTVCLERTGKKVEAKRNFIENVQNSMSSRFSDILHLAAIPFAWTSWSIIFFMGFLLVYTLGFDPIGDTSISHLPLPLSIIGVTWLGWTASYLSWCSWHFSRITTMTNNDSLPLTVADIGENSLGLYVIQDADLPSTTTTHAVSFPVPQPHRPTFSPKAAKPPLAHSQNDITTAPTPDPSPPQSFCSSPPSYHSRTSSAHSSPNVLPLSLSPHMTKLRPRLQSMGN